MEGTTLVIASHPDDEVIGCGGTIAKMVEKGIKVHIAIMTDGAAVRGIEKERRPRIGDEIRHEAESAFCAPGWRNAHMAAHMLGVESITIHNLPDAKFDTLTILEIAQIIEGHIDRVEPFTVFTHSPCDLNIDHRMVQEATAVACRPKPGHPVKSLLYYEVASSTEWSPPGMLPPFLPNYFEDITKFQEIKESVLQEAYGMEMRENLHPRSITGISILNFWRGATCGVEAAEAFMVGRLIS